MTAVWQSFAHGIGTTGADPVVTKPTGTVDGDLLIATGGNAGGNTITSPAGGGWNLHAASVSGAGPLWWKIASGEPANYTFTSPGLSNTIIVISRITGHNVTTPIDDADGVVTTSTTMVIPAVTSGGIQRLLFQQVLKFNAVTFTEPGTATPRWDASPGAGGASSGADEVVGSGSTGTRTWTAASGTGASVSYMVAIAPANQTLSVTGFDAAVAFGAPTLVQDQFVTPAGFDTPVSFGSPMLVQDVSPTGFTPTVQFGTPALELSLPVTGFDLPILFGTPALTQFAEPSGFDLTVQFGTPTVVPDGVVPVTGFDLTVSYGAPTIVGQLVVAGVVMNHETGTPVGAGAVVKLFNQDDVLVDSTVTDGAGAYVFYLPNPQTDTFWTLANYDVLGVQYHGVSDRGCAAV